MAPALIASSIFTELARFARRNTLAAAGGLVGSLIVFMALAAPLLAPRDPLKADFRRMTKPPDAQNFFGTDQVGRDRSEEHRLNSSHSQISYAVFCLKKKKKKKAK